MMTGCGGGSVPKPGDLDYVITSGCSGASGRPNDVYVTVWGCISKVQGVSYSFVCKDGQGLNALEGTNKTVQHVLAGTRYTGPVVLGGTPYYCMSGTY
jgi:hypothetical protein